MTKKRSTMLSNLAVRAVELLSRHHAFVIMPVPTGYNYPSWRVPEFTRQVSIYNTRTGQRVLGFSQTTFDELRNNHLLCPPASFPSRYINKLHTLQSWQKERVYTLVSRTSKPWSKYLKSLPKEK